MKYAKHKLSESGSTILVAIGTMGVLLAFVSIAVDYSSAVGRNAQRDRVFNNAVEIGDGCLELAFGSWRKLSGTTEAPSTSAFTAIPTPSPGMFPSFPNASIANFRVQAVDPVMTLSSENPPISALSTTTPPPKTTGPGTGTFSYFYLATVDVTLPYKSGNLTAKVRRVFEKRYTSAWNWAMLYNGDLELHPNSPLSLDGWVHTNNNAYVGNGATPPPTPTPYADGSYPDPTPVPTPPQMITFLDRLTAAGTYGSGYHPDDPRATTHTNIAEAITPANLPPGSEQVYYPFGWNPNLFSTTDSNANNDGFREMIEKPTSSTDPVSKDRLYNQAGVVVEISSSGDASKPNQMSVRAIGNADGTRTGAYTSQPSSGTAAREAWDIAAAALNADSSGKFAGTSFQDNREAATVNVVDVNVGQIVSALPSNTKAWNGVLYISDTRGSSSSQGIRVTNGTRVPGEVTVTNANTNKKRKVTGITIVSDNPVYIKGDFNTGGLPPSSDPTNPDPTEPETSNYDRRPASIMADAITLLSNNWVDTNSTLGLSSRVAANTTVNAALVAGNVPTAGGNYSGGGENFVRFLEDWTGKTFTYYGAMMNMYASKQADSPWGAGNVYEAPSLKWHFDTKLSIDSSGNPVSVPGYVSTVAYLQQQRWYLQY